MKTDIKTEINREKRIKSQILTVPNLLSFLRILMIPLFVVLYANENYHATGYILILSGLTDIVDGFIARRFNMISDFGKVLDPFADKLTQAAMLICLFVRFPLMLLPFLAMFVKELFMSISGLLVIKKTGKVFGALWHGKAATVLLYGMMILHIFWYNIPKAVSDITILICTAMVCVSLVLYGMRNTRAIRERSSKKR